MREDLLTRWLREVLEEDAKMPPEERFRDMVRRGVIDEEGRVLVRMPEPPNGERPKKKRSKKKPKADA